MAKLTLLDMVQDILSDMNDDEVNSLSDTVESLQVAQVVKSVYFEMMASKNWPHLRVFDNLTALGDTARPTHMRVPELCKELEWIEYNNRTEADPTRNKYERIEWKSIDDFLLITNGYDNTAADGTEVEDFSGIKFNIKTDVHPKYWTTFDDDYVVFDSYLSTLDTTLQSSQTRAAMFIEPAWQMTDTFIPDLPSEAFPALLAEAKSTAFARIKQMPDQKAEQQSLRQRNWLSRKAWQVAGGIKLPSYGRRSRK